MSRLMRRCIDAEKVIEELSKVPWYNRDDERQAVRIVREFSTADVQEVRQGRWIRTGEDGYCSVCKCDMPMFRNDWEWEYTETPYCPNCGASMTDDNATQHTGCVENALDALDEVEDESGQSD